MSDSWGVHCNVAEPRKAMRIGAKAWICNTNPGWGGERLEIFARSRGGREIRIWEARKHLVNFRAGWLPEHLRQTCREWASREEAQEWADAMNTALVRS